MVNEPQKHHKTLVLTVKQNNRIVGDGKLKKWKTMKTSCTTMKTNQKPWIKQWKCLGKSWKLTKHREKSMTFKTIVNDGWVKTLASVAMVKCVQKTSVSHRFDKKNIAVALLSKFYHRSSLDVVTNHSFVKK